MGHLAALRADGTQTVAEEEGEPAEHKNTNDHGQHKGEPFLPSQLCPPPPPLPTRGAHTSAQEHLAT